MKNKKISILINKKGFTLIELLTVVAIIAILAAIAIPKYNQYLLSSEVGAAYGSIASLKKLIENEYAQGKINSGQIKSGLSVSHFGVSPNALNTGTITIPKIKTSGKAIVQFKFNGNVSGSISNKMIEIVRNQKGKWHCKTSVSKKYSPSSCQHV